MLHEFLIGFKIRICKSSQNRAGCCSADPALIFNHRFRIEHHSKLVVKLEFSVLIYENKKMIHGLWRGRGISFYIFLSQLSSADKLRFNVLQYLQDMETLARSLQLWSHFPVTVSCTSEKSHLSVYLFILFVHTHSADIPVPLDKTA